MMTTVHSGAVWLSSTSFRPLWHMLVFKAKVASQETKR